MTALLLSLLLAGRPVQAPFRGELEALDFSGHSTGVLATFEPGTAVAQGKAAIDACSVPVSGKATVRAAFLRTAVAQLAVAHPAEPPTARALLTLAQCLSKQHGVKETNAFFYPRAESGVEVEAVWSYQQGARVERTVFPFREDTEYTRYVRRAITRAEFVAHQWQAYPISELARKLGLPGRDALERHSALMWEGADAPTDAGEDLVRTSLFLTRGVALELLQEAEATHHSPSMLVAEALQGAEVARALGDGTAEGPATETNKARALFVYLPRPLLATVEAVGDTKGESVSVLVQKAWRRAHGDKDKDKEKSK